MPKHELRTDGPTVPETATDEPRDVLVETTRKQVRIPCGNGFAIVSGRPNFPITRSQADALVAQGAVRIIETTNPNPAQP